MAGFMKTIKNLLLFDEPKKIEEFILRENEDEDPESESDSERSKNEPRKRKNEELLLKKREIPESEFDGGEKNKKEDEKPDISKALSENLEYLKKVYHYPLSGDIIIREFDVVVKDRVIAAFIIFIDGMVDRKVVNDDILQPLMLLSNLEIKGNEKDIANFIKSHILPHNQLKEVRQYRKVIDEVNFGGCGLFVDGIDVAFAMDVKGFSSRGVERPNTELVIRGPQEGFTETIRINTALIRKRLKDADLIVENMEIGVRSKTPVSMMYIKDIANESLVKEVRRRLKSIKVDYIGDSGELEQLIEDSSFIPSPQITATERPDKVSNALIEGKVGVIVHGSPFALVMPTTAVELIHSAEDVYLRFPYTNLLRLIRILGVIASLLLPGLYLAVTNYHQEMIPTDLILAIEASREKVPFPSVVEILIMEISFELIREAGIRIPGPIGPTLGIIGALILGQAAVAANIVSPILIIVVAVTGIGSFAIPNFSLSFSYRILRFGYIFLGASAGFLGITLGIFMHSVWLAGAKSFGVPFMIPFGPKTSDKIYDTLTKAPVWKHEERPDYLNTKAKRRQAKISRGWTRQESEEERDGDKDAK